MAKKSRNFIWHYKTAEWIKYETTRRRINRTNVRQYKAFHIKIRL